MNCQTRRATGSCSSTRVRTSGIAKAVATGRFRNTSKRTAANASLLSGTPYNKTYLDLSSQLQLFVPAEHDLGIRPERLLKELGETEFIRRHQCPVRSLAAFEKSEYPDDWRDLMRLYLVRRTRCFIKDNYAEDRPGERSQVPDLRHG